MVTMTTVTKLTALGSYTAFPQINLATFKPPTSLSVLLGKNMSEMVSQP